MPAISAKRQAHLDRIAHLPQVKRNQFKPGKPAHNRNGKWIPCDTCGKKIYRNKGTIKKHKNHFCSKECIRRPHPVQDQAVALYKQGYKHREIAELMGRRIGTISRIIHKAKVQDRWGFGTSSTAERNRARKLLPDHCELCGYHRVVEVAHAEPRANGGSWNPDNVMSLCPNCHHLFDHALLTESEKSILEDARASRKK